MKKYSQFRSRISRFFWFVVLVCSFAAFARAETFGDGDVVCFYGDSITHGGRFHYYIYDYYLTRFPEKNITFVNAGVAGDNAGAAMTRIEEDIFVKNPSHVVLMFGMNDVGRGNYVADPSPEQSKRQENALLAYERNMKQLVSALCEKNAPTLIFLTPSPFDDTGENDRNNNQPGCNGGLGRCAEIVKNLADALNSQESTSGGAQGVPLVVDFHDQMTTLNLAKQATNPHFTLIGPDRVHPGATGHYVMAWLFLRAQNAPSLVSRVEISADDATIASVENAQVSELRHENGALSFCLCANALPWPIESGGRAVLEFVPLAKDLNQEILRIRHLPPGQYALKIDGISVGEYSSEQFDEGIDLAFNEKTPQYQQAQRVLALSNARAVDERQLRNLAAVRWFLRLRHIDPDDLESVRAFYEALPNKTGYFETKIPNYVDTWSSHAEWEKKVAHQTTAVRAAAQPLARMYEVRQIESASK
ncbi:MAG: SGNH/GDSL hydrolase family protein [Planctomycetia bacterium]|nr:SGNH/GDSL hydrolase family protein [Planctomycetia bacterium]